MAEGRFANARMAIVMGTHYGWNDLESLRHQLAQRTLRQYAALNERTGGLFPVVVADASPAFERTAPVFESLGATVIDCRNRGGIAPQNLAGIAHALELGAPQVMRQEPEKYGWGELDLLDEITGAVDCGVDILSVGRSQRSMQTLPYNQQLTETVMSRVLARLMHGATGQYLPEDTASGIRAMSRAGAEHMLAFDAEQDGKAWEFLWYSLITAMGAGLKVGGLLLDYTHPVEMREDEQGNPMYDDKRLFQVDLIVPKVIAFAQANGFTIDTSRNPSGWQI